MNDKERAGASTGVGGTPPVLGLEALWANGGGAAVELLGVGRLLASLADSPRLASAAREGRVSYRTAWGRLVTAEAALGIALVERVKGHGSRLTPAGRELLEAIAQFETQARAQLAEPLARLGSEVERLGRRPSRGLRLAASHDLLLQRCLAERRVEEVTVRFLGSDDALAALARGEADLAGFHRPLGERPLHGTSLAPAGQEFFVLPLAVREQGLIVAPGNPMRIRDVADLARSGLRFVNRQVGAGTRAWLDRLLRRDGIAPSQIAGYEVEEPTHLAVAASVAAGTADAGFGLRAAADRFGLGFVSIGRETYWLAGATALRRDPRVIRLLACVRDLSGQTPGYDSARKETG